MRRWRIWVGVLLFIALCGYGSVVLMPILASAKAATRMTEELRDIKVFERAVQRFTEAHHGRLPRQNWKKEIAVIEPTVKQLLDCKDDDWSTGLAAIPNTSGRHLDDLPPETILFVGYRSLSNLDVLRDTRDIGHPYRTGSAVVLTAEQIQSGGSAPFEPVGRIGYRLAKQGVKLD